MYFKLEFLTHDFQFGDRKIKVYDEAKGISFSLVRASADQEHSGPGDGFLVVTCERELSPRLAKEAQESGKLSASKGAVSAVLDEMGDAASRFLRLIRWRCSCSGGPSEIRLELGFYWSLDGKVWKSVADNLFVELRAELQGYWDETAARFLQEEIGGQVDEPLGHELLREAWVNRETTPRSSIALAVAAAEVGFKQFAMRMLPDSAWLLETLQSPPLVQMLAELFPWDKVNIRINGHKPSIPEWMRNDLKKAIKLRNDIVHGRAAKSLKYETVDSALTTVRELLYFLDVMSGQRWAVRHLSSRLMGHFSRPTDAGTATPNA